MDRCVYEPFFKDGGTPIRCRSLDEVDRLFQDMSALFPKMTEKFAKLKCIFGSKDKYQSEIVYRFAYYDNGKLSANFCTYAFYRQQGYPIVEFSDILAEHGNEDEDDADWELEDLAVLFS